MKYLKTITILAVAAVLAGSCKKDDDTTTTYSYLNGIATMQSMPAFVAPGQVFDFEASGVSLPSDATSDVELVCKFKTSLESEYTDCPDCKYHVVVPDTASTFSVTCAFSATGYYGSSYTTHTIILTEGSVPKAPKVQGNNEFTDQRDGSTYLTAWIGGNEWMRSNLVYGGKPFLNSETARGFMGSFYTWSEAQTACPAGWRLPKAEEFEALNLNAGAYMMPDAAINSEKMWPGEGWPLVDANDASGFSAMPLGYASVVGSGCEFAGYGQYAVFWASESGSPCCFYLNENVATFTKWTGMGASDFAANLRCVKNDN